jgi:hypothetical protein
LAVKSGAKFLGILEHSADRKVNQIVNLRSDLMNLRSSIIFAAWDMGLFNVHLAA